VKKSEHVRRVIAGFGEWIQQKAWTVGRDPAAEKRKQFAWGIAQGTAGAVFTIGARRLGARVWGVLTGETPPAKR
jgi:hypothetical protein